MMQKALFERFCDLFEIKQVFYSMTCIFDVQYNIVAGIGISFFVSNLIRINFTFSRFCDFPFTVAMEISISLKIKS